MNRYIGTGRLTKDPELRELPDDGCVCEMRVAVDGMGRGKEVGYINVSVYGASGKAAANVLAKGWKIAIDGRLQWEQWEAEDGSKRQGYRVVGYVEFLSEPRSEKDEQTAEPVEAAAGSKARGGRREKAAA
jgi:single-strand DNA-binding protein